MIQITKVADGFLAHATQPHVKVEWRAETAMTARALIAELKALGAHQTDIGDALYAADPDWLK